MRWFGRRKDLRSNDPSPAFETLESRLALYQGPMISGMPPLASLENPNDSVVRIDTNVGKIDIELFDQLAPGAVAAFKAYVNSGKFDESIFDAMTPGALFGGRAKWSDTTHLTPIVPNAATPNGLTRSNLQGTLTFVPINATQVRNIFAINLANNPVFDTASGGYTVFGKVVQGWNVVQTIATFATQNLNTQFGTPNGPYTRVPVTGAYNAGVGPTEATLVRITDIEVVKVNTPNSNNGNLFFVHTLVYPEGFRSATTTESIGMVNLDPNRINYYQVIVRYETGDRDSVILTGGMAPGARITLKINDASQPTYNLVRSGVGYAIEIRTTRAFSAQLNHRDTAGSRQGDLGVLLDQSFQILARVFPGQLQTWKIGGGEKGALSRSYVLIENLTDVTANVNILLTNDNGTTKFVFLPLKAARRGGVSVGDLTDFADGNYSVLITSNQPIVAAISQYKTGGGQNLTDGDTALGTINGGSTEGYLAAAQVPASGSSQFDLYYSDGNIGAVTVNFQFILSDGTVLNGNPVLLTSAQRRKTVSISSLNPSLPTGQFFSVKYSVSNGVTPVTVSYRADVAGDFMTTPFQTLASEKLVFADGYTDPTLNANQFNETISIYNPYGGSTSLFFDLIFHFSDTSNAQNNGPMYAYGGAGTALGSHQRIDLHASDFAAIATKINSNPAFRFYSVEVVGFPFTGQQVTGGIVAQITRTHNTWGMNMTSIPALNPDQPLVFLNAAEFH